MKEIPVTFKNKGKEIIGKLHLPNKQTETIIILVHGFSGDKNGPDDIFIKLARELSKNSFAALRFDCRGSGESDGNFEDMTIAGEVSDLKRAIEFVEKKDYKVIGAVGESMGATVSIIGYDDRIKCMVLWYPALYLKETSLSELLSKENKQELNKRGYVHLWGVNVGKKYIEEFPKIDIEDDIKKIKCPIFFLHGNNDVDVHHNQSERAFKLANEPKKLEIISGAEHCFRGNNREEWQNKAVELTVDWFKKW